MLKQRVITALVLLAILLPALFASNPLAFHAIVLLILTAGAWEWAKVNGVPVAGTYLTAVVMLLACGVTWWSGWLAHPPTWLWFVAGAAWVMGSAVLIQAGVPGWGRIALPVRWLGGMLALWVAGVAMVQAKAIGLNFLLSVLMLVWVADVFAYFFGKAFGLRIAKQKLAPSISPGKSWEGAWGGVLGVVLMAFIWIAADKALHAPVASLYTRLDAQGGWLVLLAAIFLAAMSVVGDLVESLIKRSGGMKDSSQLLPGHGGVLDRIDALLPTLPLAMMLNSLVH